MKLHAHAKKRRNCWRNVLAGDHRIIVLTL